MEKSLASVDLISCGAWSWARKQILKVRTHMSFVEEDTQLDIPEILVDREVAALALRDEHLATEGCHLDDPVYHCFTVDMVIDRLVQDIGRPLLDEELIFLSEELELDSKINPVKYGPMYLMPGDSRNRPEVTPKYTCPVSRAWR